MSEDILALHRRLADEWERNVEAAEAKYRPLVARLKLEELVGLYGVVCQAVEARVEQAQRKDAAPSPGSRIGR